MELSEFITDTLTGIVNGVETANNEHIRFELNGDHNDYTKGIFVDFDIAVTAEDKSQSGAKVKTGIMVVGAFLTGSAEGKKESTNQNVSRIKFKIFVRERGYPKPTQSPTES